MNNNPYQEVDVDVSVLSLYDLTDKDAHQSLYIAVVLQALLDLTKPTKENEKSSIQLERDQAHSWIFKEVGVTCRNFSDTCYYAGLQPDTVRHFAFNIINSEDIIDVRRRFHSLL
tara:strand:+ start:1890 stop:2234 length:345 start_codon:yes stop_codon:yes gene_type:complete